MKTLKYLLLLTISGLVLSCASGSRTDPKTGIVTKYFLIGTDAQSVVIDGPIPTVIGYQPIYSKTGKTIIGQQPLFGPPVVGTPNALYAAYGQDQSKGLGKVTSVVQNSITSYVASSVLKSYDDNKTTVDLAKESTTKSSNAANSTLELAKENNRSAEAMVKLTK